MQTTPLEPTVTEPGSSDNPPPDCPALVEQLAEYVDEIDMFAHCLVFLIGEVPRGSDVNNSDVQRAFKRVGRMAEKVADAATTAALQAGFAVELVRRPHKAPSNGNDSGANGNGHDEGA